MDQGEFWESCAMIMLGSATIVLGLVTAVWAARSADRKVSLESTAGPTLHTQACGATLNWFTYSAPFARVTVYADIVVIRVPGRTVDLRRADIKAATTVLGLFSLGIRIRHGAPHAPSLIIIWSMSPSELLRHLSPRSEGSLF